MSFRSKSAERLIAELLELSTTYGTFRFLTTDAIVDYAHLKTLFPALASSGIGYDIFFEVKSNLGRDQLRVLRRGGVARIQPGIESLSTQVLAVMDKGVTALQNINFLRWSRYYDFSVDWNLLWGFPGEDERAYMEMAETIGHLHHLPPPVNVGPVQMHRFSPIFRDRQRFPVRFSKAEASYAFAFPPGIDLDAIAYYFDYEFDEPLPTAGHALVKRAVDEWQRRWQQGPTPQLTFRFAPGIVWLEDTRSATQAATYTLRGPLAEMYALCSERALPLSRLRTASGEAASNDEITAALAGLVTRGLLARDGDNYIALALPAGPPL
jgi:ribosomal peptide maturation radical SAM protein 1